MPRLKVNAKLAPFLTKQKPIKVAIGGRGSGKSIGFGDMLTMKMETEGADIYCLREYQDSILDSVHRVFCDSVEQRLHLSGWSVQENKVISPRGAKTNYKGASRNPDSIQSAQGYKYSWFEEAHRASKSSLDKLLPTIIRNPGAECWFSANPQSSGDAFSQRFIVPYQKELDEHGYYEDDMHLIVVINWRDNPWWNEEQERLRQWDYDNRPRAEYDWIWEGKYNDSIEDSIIAPEWYDSCISAHEKLGWEAQGAKYAAHDPSDLGPDDKGYAARHGSVIYDVQSMSTGTVNDGARWACDLAIQQQVDHFTWDGDGMGAPLREQIAKSFQGKNTSVSMFRGSEAPDNPDSIFNPTDKHSIQGSLVTKDAVRNKRAQYYAELRRRMYNTYLAVERKQYFDPDDMISLDSSIGCLNQLRSELCRMPIKPNGNGKIELYTKQVLKDKFKLESPNLADSVMMLMRVRAKAQQEFHMPRPIRAAGRR